MLAAEREEIAQADGQDGSSAVRAATAIGVGYDASEDYDSAFTASDADY